MDRLPDELIRHVSDYGGLYTAKSIADTSRSLRDVYDVPGLVEEIKLHRASTEECNMYRDTLREVDHVMQMMNHLLFEEDPNISSSDTEYMLLNYDPMWFTIGERMYEKAQEYMDTLHHSYWVRLGHYGPETHEYRRAKACSELLNAVVYLINRFETWVRADMHSRDRIGFRAREMKGLELHIPDVEEKYNNVKNLLARCIEARPASTSRQIYSFGRKSRRPIKGKKHRYAIDDRQDDSGNKGLDSLPDEALRLISDYGGLYSAKSMADTSRSLRGVYNVPGLVDEIKTHRASMEECNMYKDTLRQVDHVMHMMYSIMNQPNITPDEVTDILVNYDPMWFSLAETMYRKAQEYNTFAYTEEVPMDYYGPSTHAYERARACADLLHSVGSFMSRFNSWVTIGNNSRQTARLRARQLKELELHLPEISAFYDKVESLLNMCMETRPAPTTSRKIYNFGMKGRRSTKGKKKYAIDDRQDDSGNKGLDSLPDELIRHISDYGGLHTARSIADTSSRMRSIYNIPVLKEEINLDKECPLLKDVIDKVDYVLNTINKVFVANRGGTRKRAKEILLNMDPDWFDGYGGYIDTDDTGEVYDMRMGIADVARELSLKIFNFYQMEEGGDYLPFEQEGPVSRVYSLRSMMNSILTNLVTSIRLFNTWVEDTPYPSGDESLIRELTRNIRTVMDQKEQLRRFYNECTSRMTTPMIYNFGRKSRRPIKGKRAKKSNKAKKAKKHTYALGGGRDMINRITQSIVDQVLPAVIEDVNSYTNLVDDVYHFFETSKPRGESKTWVGIFGGNICEYSPFVFTGPLNDAILALDEHLYLCDNEDNQGTIEYWINDVTSPLSLSDMIYDSIYDLVARGKDINAIYRHVQTKFSEPAFTHTVYKTVRNMFTSTDIARLE